MKHQYQMAKARLACTFVISAVVAVYAIVVCCYCRYISSFILLFHVCRWFLAGCWTGAKWRWRIHNKYIRDRARTPAQNSNRHSNTPRLAPYFRYFLPYTHTHTHLVFVEWAKQIVFGVFFSARFVLTNTETEYIQNPRYRPRNIYRIYFQHHDEKKNE